MLFTDEVMDMNELVQKLVSLNNNLDKIKVAVVCFIFDSDGKLILHRRGPGARDEIGKLQAIGGSVNNNDANFRCALARELIEEAGKKANIRIGEFIGAQLDSKTDTHTSEFINWVVLAYKGYLIDGELINSEPDRCIGFEKNNMSDFKEEDLSSTANRFIKQMIDTEKQ